MSRPKDHFTEADMVKEYHRGQEDGVRLAASLVMVAAKAHFSMGRDEKARELREVAETILSSRGLK